MIIIKHRYAFLLAEFQYLRLEAICSNVEKLLAQKDEEAFLFLGKPVNSPGIWEKNENIIYNLAKGNQFDGIISFNNTLASNNGEVLLQQYLSTFTNSNMVLIEDEMVGNSSIKLDNYHSSQLILNHLYEHGLRRFAYISGPLGTRDALERYNGVQDYLTKKNIPRQDFLEGNFTLESGHRFVRSFFEDQKQLPEVFVCANDEMAVGVYNALKSYGINVPQDVKIVGFDDIDRAQYLETPLTTIKQPFLGMVVEGLEIIRKKTTSKVMFPGELIVRESCGCKSSIKNAEEEYFEKKTYIEKYQHLYQDYIDNLQLQALLSSIDNHEQLIERLKMLLVNYQNFEFHICLFHQKEMAIHNSLEFEFPENMNCFLSFVNGEFIENIEFRTENILPDSVREKSSTRVFFVYPLRIAEVAFGYIVCNTNTAYDLRFISLKDLINVALNRIEMQRRLEYYRTELEALSYRDSLTGIYNHRGFHKFAEPIFEENIAKGLRPAVIYVDVDHLKKINDTYGHSVGDAIIQGASKVLKEYFQDEVVARIGGDEYIVFIGDFSSYSQSKINEDLNEIVRQKNEEFNEAFTLEITFGLCVYDDARHRNLEEMIVEADRLLYEKRKFSRQLQL